MCYFKLNVRLFKVILFYVIIGHFILKYNNLKQFDI